MSNLKEQNSGGVIHIVVNN